VLAGLPQESWVLIGAAVGLGLAVELVFLWTQRHGQDPDR
jgi:nitrogen fixation-related uncharacterized protein